MGVSGSVEIWKTPKGDKYAVKIYHEKEAHELRKEYQKRVLFEYRLLKQLKHEAFFLPSKYTISWSGLTVSMYMEAGLNDLAALLRKQGARQFNVAENMCYWRQLVSGIAYLHEQGMSHRDIKLENMLLERATGRLKIIDMATVTTKKPALGIVGSPRYMAPEMASQIRYDGQIADVWSLGIVLVFFATRKFLWKTAHIDDEKFEMWSKDQKLEDLALPASLNNLVVALLTIDPEQRMCTTDLLRHSFCKSLPCCQGSKSCGVEHRLLKVLEIWRSRYYLFTWIGVLWFCWIFARSSQI